MLQLHKADGSGDGAAPAIAIAIHDLEKSVVRHMITHEKIRPDGREVEEVRPVTCEVGLLPRTHGSGLFTRGQTQVMTVTTLGSLGDEQIIDGLGQVCFTSLQQVFFYLCPALQALLKSYELDPGNPVVGYNLALLLRRQGDLERAQFYIRRLNNSELANAQSLWLGMKIEHALRNDVALRQLSEQLQRRFPQSPEAGLWARRAFDE